MSAAPGIPTSEERRCQAKSKRSGEQCKRWAAPGSTVCVKHGAGAPQVKAAARRRLMAAQVEGEVGRLREELGHQVEGMSEPEVLLWALREAHVMAWVCSAALNRLGFEPGPDGLYGPDHLGDGKPHVLFEMHRGAVNDTGRLAKMAIDAGLSARRVELEEAQGAQLAAVMRSTFDGARARLVELGAPVSVVEQVFAAELPQLVRAAIDAAVGGAPGSAVSSSPAIDVGSTTEGDPG